MTKDRWRASSYATFYVFLCQVKKKKSGSATGAVQRILRHPVPSSGPEHSVGRLVRRNEVGHWGRKAEAFRPYISLLMPTRMPVERSDAWTPSNDLRRIGSAGMCSTGTESLAALFKQGRPNRIHGSPRPYQFNKPSSGSCRVMTYLIVA